MLVSAWIGSWIVGRFVGGPVLDCCAAPSRRVVVEAKGALPKPASPLVWELLYHNNIRKVYEDWGAVVVASPGRKASARRGKNICS